MLGFSTFGSAPAESSRKMAQAAELVRQRRPGLNVDGELQADVALSEDLRNQYPFTALKGPANVLVFPNLDASNIGYRLVQSMAGADVIGPVILGLRKPAALLTPQSTVDDIVHLTTIAASKVGTSAAKNSVP
jgi:malate dehydrogenase (oxaloacetate-decarboxylating)(NADP+)